MHAWLRSNPRAGSAAQAVRAATARSMDVFILWLVLAVGAASRVSSERYPGIAELVPSLSTGSGSGASPAVLDLRRLEARPLLPAPAPAPVPARRQAYVPWVGVGYFYGTEQRARRKTCDCMLQTLYMARFDIIDMRAESVGASFKRTDTAYRVAYGAKGLVVMSRKLMHLYQTMEAHRPDWVDIKPLLVLHHKAVRLHLDFLHLWWVLTRLDGAHRRPRELQGSSGSGEAVAGKKGGKT